MGSPDITYNYPCRRCDRIITPPGLGFFFGGRDQWTPG